MAAPLLLFSLSAKVTGKETTILLMESKDKTTMEAVAVTLLRR
jgi:hypothetical protein